MVINPVDAHTQRGPKGKLGPEHTNSGSQGSSSSGNTAEAGKGKYLSFLYNGDMCTKCHAHKMINTTYTMRGNNCILCG